jgi:peptide deformylase
MKLSLILAPDPIYKTQCTLVAVVDDAVRDTLDAMMAALQDYEAIGLAAPMVGLKQRLVVIRLEDEAGVNHHYEMVNPEITERSTQTQTLEEASITFLGISAPVTRPREVTVRYLDRNGVSQTLEAKGLLAACVQHEMDYLDGKTFIDYQPPMKRDVLTRKMAKYKKLGHAPHVHSASCRH